MSLPSFPALPAGHHAGRPAPEPLARSYMPAHDPAVHGHAYAVKTAGRDTQPFTAIRSYPPCLCEQCRWAMDVGGGFTGECKCDECKYTQTPGSDATLYAGDDAIFLLERAAIRDGRYEDSEAFGARVHRGRMADFDAHHEHVRRTLGRAARQIAFIRGRAS